MRAILIGAMFGFFYMVAIAALSFRQILHKAKPVAGVELLTPGATTWQSLPSAGGERMWISNDRLLVGGKLWDGSKWQPSGEVAPSFPMHPTIAGVYWHALGGGEWLTVREGSCAPSLGDRALPEIPRCLPEKIHYRLSAATRSEDGAVLVLVWHDADRTSRVWKLAPGADAWVDTGELPLSSVSAKLVAGKGAEVLASAADGTLARYDGQKWHALPKAPGDRLGRDAALAPDGSVYVVGGFEDTSKSNAAWQLAVSALFLVAAIVVWRKFSLGIIGMFFGAGLGVGLSVALFFAVWILIGARF